MTTTTIQRSPAPPGMLVSYASKYSAGYVYTLDKTGERIGAKSFDFQSAVHRFVPREQPQRAYWFHESRVSKLELKGWLERREGAEPRLTPIGENTTDDTLRWFESEHAQWHGAQPLQLRVGQPAPLRDSVLRLLIPLDGAPGCGPGAGWAKGTLSIVTREIRPGEVRLLVKAHTEHPYMQRTARFDLEGELTLSLPSGWPKSFRSEGSWSVPGANLRGEQTIRGTFQDEDTWTYTPNASPPLPLPVEAPKAP